MCEFDRLNGCGVFRMGSTLAVASPPERLHTAFLESKMQSNQDTERRNQPQLDDRSKDEQPCQEDSAEVVGNSLNVNKNDVRNPSRPGTDAVKDEQQPHEGSVEVVGNALDVNENDVRNQNRHWSVRPPGNGSV